MRRERPSLMRKPPRLQQLSLLEGLPSAEHIQLHESQYGLEPVSIFEIGFYSLHLLVAAVTPKRENINLNILNSPAC